MKNIEDMTTEVPSTSLQPKVTAEEITLQSINGILLKTFSHENADNFKAGQARQGQRASTSTTILKDLLYKEIEDLHLTRGTENTERAINSMTRKTLMHQVDNIISILEMSTNKTADNRYYMLGILVKALYQK
jgi:hypothetical protein